MISADVIEDIRARNELVSFIESNGVPLRRSGADYIGRCPFHDDHNPSLSVSSRKQLWCCRGACSAGGKGVGGDVIAFAQKLWGLSFRETVERLGGIPAKSTCSRPAAAEAARQELPQRTRRFDLLNQLADFYHKTYLSTSAAKVYASSRGLADEAMLATLPLGYADGSLLDRIPEGSKTYEALRELGVIGGSGRELMGGCLVIPLRDLGGNVVGLYGRSIEGDRHLHLPGPRRGLVNAPNAAATSQLIVAESVFDALSFLQAGIPNVVPIYGTGGWSPDHDELIEKHGIRSIVLALDSDDAGQRAAAAFGERLSVRGLEVRSVLMPTKDPNELLVREGAAGFRAIWEKLFLAAPIIGRAAPTAAPATPTSPTAAGPRLTSADGMSSLVFGARTYRIRTIPAQSPDRMRVNLRVEQGPGTHVDTLDLYSARARKSFEEAAVEALGLDPKVAAELRREMAQLLDALERERAAARPKGKDPAEVAPLTPGEREAALDFLRAPDLIARLRADFAAVGCVGEETPLLVGYLAALSRKLTEPLSVLFCARSGAGKSNLQERITDFVPPEDLIRYTRITGQALFYQDENALVHKLLAIDEEGGAADAAYSLRNLQSGGSLSVSSTRTDPQTGKQKAEAYKVNGPTSIFLTTTNPEALDFETRNRFVMLTVDESKEQTRKILERQRWAETLDGLLARKSKDSVIRRHHNIQRLIEAVPVVNNLAPTLQYPDGRLILRREQKKYLTLIKAIALLHQHQRPRKAAETPAGPIEYIEVVSSDVELAAFLAQTILRRNLDELAPPTRSLLVEIDRLVTEKRRSDHDGPPTVDRREIQRATGLSYWHLRIYLGQLVEFDYISPTRGHQGKKYEYELLWDGEDEDLTAAMTLSTQT